MVARLQEAGYLVRVEDHVHSVGHCDRCDTVVEPIISLQWWLKMAPLAEPAIQVARDGTVTFIPERFKGIYLHWMENVHDWCLSRQLWWGHRIPVWYCDTCGKLTVARERQTLPALRLERARPGSRRPRHLVQLGALAIQHRGACAEHPGPERR
ncbi:MAG: class I tRNA ligase family protein [Sphaerobacter sp.]|nr:class I tRNA ligase family protein [Sphaerobacter sp.]